MRRMKYPSLQPDLEQVIGYLNFSSGTFDARVFRSLDNIFSAVDKDTSTESDSTTVTQSPLSKSQSLIDSPNEIGVFIPEFKQIPEIERSNIIGSVYLVFQDALELLPETSSAFTDLTQASSVISFVFQTLLPEYRKYHSDLLFHQINKEIFNAFFIGRCFQTVLQLKDEKVQEAEILRDSIERLNDHLGYRPVATLEKVSHSSYSHEKHRPLPIYIQEAGVCNGKYSAVTSKALDILKETSPDILRRACVDLDCLKEIAVDLRPYDFEHPVNRRPNHHFGGWDPDLIDNQGYFQRYVVSQITIESILERVYQASDEEKEFVEFEAAAVLAGTILMGAGICGSGPGFHDSTVTLTSLLFIIADYRDDFYDSLLESLDGKIRDRLDDERTNRRQPFGGARQHLNSQLAKRRALQVQHVQLTKIYAKMGYTAAAAKEVSVVKAGSARINAQIDCLIASITPAIDTGKLEKAFECLIQIEQWINRGIQCGAIIDPWNLLGFDANFPLFPSPDNSISDHRADDLVLVMEQVFDLYSRLLSEIAVSEDKVMRTQVEEQFKKIVRWWRQYAAHEISALESADPEDIFEAAKHVADALALWKKGGAAAGDVAFWAGHTEIFGSPKAYQLVVDALLDRKDIVGSMALLINWLSQARWLGLVSGDTSYHDLVYRWLGLQRANFSAAKNFEQRQSIWDQTRKFYDFLEANAGGYWEVPSFQFGKENEKPKSQHPEMDSGLESQDDYNDPDSFDKDPFGPQDPGDSLFPNGDDDDQKLFGAAYEDLIYNDSTDDGIEGSIDDGSKGNSSNVQAMEAESDRLVDRLSFLSTLAFHWTEISNITLPQKKKKQLTEDHHQWLRKRAEALDSWVEQARKYESDLARLLSEVHSLKLPKSNGDITSLVEYDRLRLFKESTMDKIMSCSVEMQLAVRSLRAVQHGLCYLAGDCQFGKLDLDPARNAWVSVYAGILLRERRLVEHSFDNLIDNIKDRPLLYIPLSKGGNPMEMIDTRVRQQCFQKILASLPVLGMFRSTYRLLEEARAMERNNSVGIGAVTEFDEMFRGGFGSMVHSLVYVTQEEKKAKNPLTQVDIEDLLFNHLEQLTESMLLVWLAHSRTLRLSVLEKVIDANGWNSLVQFIKRYGGQIFTQDFFSLGNIRGILHQGPDHWLRQMQDNPQALDLELLNDLDHDLPWDHAVRMLTLILEAIIENYSAYRDYNSTTTQSDRGDMLYTFLDFVRLRTKYDRVAWHLKPVIWCHEKLARRQENKVAGRWRRQLWDRVQDEAGRYQQRLSALQSKYAMKMPTVADRINESFVQPLHIDRICALVKPAMDRSHLNTAEGSFELLQKEIEALTETPIGIGLEVPAWLVLLEQEVENNRAEKLVQTPTIPESLIEPIPLRWERLQKEIDNLPTDN